MKDAVKLKQTRYKTYKALAKAGLSSKAKDAKGAYNEAKRFVKRAVWQTKSKAEKEKFAYILPNNSSIFKLAKQMDRTNQDVVGEK